MHSVYQSGEVFLSFYNVIAIRNVQFQMLGNAVAQDHRSRILVHVRNSITSNDKIQNKGIASLQRTLVSQIVLVL